MSLFDRLYHILRSNLHAARDTISEARRGQRSSERQSGQRAGKQDYTRNEWRHTGASGNRSYQEESRSRQSTPPGQDPLIAQLYANLELDYGADEKAIKAARKRLLRQYHPDRFHGNEADNHVAQELTKEINRAHDELIKWLKTR